MTAGMVSGFMSPPTASFSNYISRLQCVDNPAMPPMLRSVWFGRCDSSESMVIPIGHELLSVLYATAVSHGLTSLLVILCSSIKIVRSQQKVAMSSFALDHHEGQTSSDMTY